MASSRRSGWAGLFWTAFRQSRNPMVLVESHRIHVDVNGAYLEMLGYSHAWMIGRSLDEIITSPRERSVAATRAALARGKVTGRAEVKRSDGRRLAVQYAAHEEVVTGRSLVLGVAVTTSRPSHVRPASAAAGSLSERELEILRFVAAGWSGPEIARELRISHNTVRTHIGNAMTKLGARSRAHLVAIALGDGVVLA